MILQEKSERFFFIKEEKAIALTDAPECELFDITEVYAYVIDTEDDHYSRLFMADSKEDAIEKAKAKMEKCFHQRAFVGISVGEDKNKLAYFQDVAVLLNVQEKLNEELSSGLSRQISIQTDRVGTRMLKATGEKKVNLLGALTVLSQAQSVKDDSQGRKLLNLAKRMMNANPEG